MHRYSTPTDADDDEMSVDHPSTSSLTLTMYFSSDGCWLTPPRPPATTSSDPEDPTEPSVEEETKQEESEENDVQNVILWREVLGF